MGFTVPVRNDVAIILEVGAFAPTPPKIVKDKCFAKTISKTLL